MIFREVGGRIVVSHVVLLLVQFSRIASSSRFVTGAGTIVVILFPRYLYNCNLYIGTGSTGIINSAAASPDARGVATGARLDFSWYFV